MDALRRRALLLALGLAASASSAAAEVVTRCGGSEGTAYSLPSRLGAKAETGWQADGISKGGLILLRDAAGGFDVVYTDSSGGTRSAKGDGFGIVSVPQPAANVHLLIGVHAGSGVVEHWLFHLDGGGRGEAVWGTIRGTGLFPKSALFRAACFAP